MHDEQSNLEDMFDLESNQNWRVLFQHGGRAFDLWRDVVDSYILINNFLIGITAHTGELMETDRPPLEFNQVIILAARIRSRLDGVGIQLHGLRSYEADPLGHYLDLLGLLAKVEYSLMCEAYANDFNNEAPHTPSNVVVN